jgi:hypothetical protein
LVVSRIRSNIIEMPTGDDRRAVDPALQLPPR